MRHLYGVPRCFLPYVHGVDLRYGCCQFGNKELGVVSGNMRFHKRKVAIYKCFDGIIVWKRLF